MKNLDGCHLEMNTLLQKMSQTASNFFANRVFMILIRVGLSKVHILFGTVVKQLKVSPR